MGGPMISRRSGVLIETLCLLVQMHSCIGKEYSLRFHGFTSGIRIWRVLDMVLGTFCKEIVDDGMSQWRGDVMNV